MESSQARATLKGQLPVAKMSAHVEVVSTDLRRVKVKVTPGTYLVDVLAEACKKMNLQSDKYELK